jgi:hypothetical protein
MWAVSMPAMVAAASYQFPDNADISCALRKSKVCDSTFEPAQLGSWDLTNRVAMAPMSRFRADPKTWVPADYTAE